MISSLELSENIYRLESESKHKLESPILSRIEETCKKVEDTIDDILYWDENLNLLYIEAIAVFKSTAEFVRFRANLPTEFHLSELECPVCGCKVWKTKNIDVKTVKDKKDKSWKCLSVIFACKKCLEVGRTSERSIKILGLKYALIKLGRGVKHLLDRIKRIKIEANLATQTGAVEVELDTGKIRLERCPLL